MRFGDFVLDPANRRLTRGSEPIELGGRYLDALLLLAGAPGQLISKDRLHEEVWRGVPVTDEALSQAIMALRKALGDDAARPRFIETVPRHGYRFVGLVEGAVRADHERPEPRSPTLDLATRGILGAIAAGLLVGLTYGIGAAGSGAGGAMSLVIVLIAVSVLAAMISGLGVAGGIALALRQDREAWWLPIAGGALGGLAVGGFARLVGIDTLRLLMGSAPDRMTGAIEGLVMGGIVGWAVWALRNHMRPLALASVALAGAVGGAALVTAGGSLMAGSLAALVGRFPGAGLSMAWAQWAWLRPLSGAFEGAAFTLLVSTAMARKAP